MVSLHNAGVITIKRLSLEILLSGINSTALGMLLHKVLCLVLMHTSHSET